VMYPGNKAAYQIDGAVTCGNHLISIFEVKDEIGSTKAEPYAQAILYYTHSGRDGSEAYSTFNVPCLIVSVFGLILLSSLAVKC
jgi:hypothetical protein